jgi:uncharacterized membrane protein HdeD (DUF308 family)
MKEIENTVTGLQQKVLSYFQAHWRLFMVEGILFMAFGLGAIVIPRFFSVVIALFIGWIVVISGSLHIVRFLIFRNMPGFGWWLVLGNLQILVGSLIIADPKAGIFTITMLITLFFVYEGLIKTYLALKLRPLPHWDWVFFSGITALLFAAIVLASWSKTMPWVLGLLVGIYMTLLGLAIIRMSLRYKKYN